MIQANKKKIIVVATVLIVGVLIFIFAPVDPTKEDKTAAQKTVTEIPEALKGLMQIDHYFYKDDQYVYSVSYRDRIPMVVSIVVDPKTFSSTSPHVYKDKQNVYLGYYEELRVVDGADPETFEFFKISQCVEMSCSRYYRDKDHVFYETKLISSDPENFEEIPYFDFGINYPGYVEPEIPDSPIRLFRDTKNVYWGSKILENVDRDTVKHLGLNYFADAKKVFIVTRYGGGMKVMVGANPQTFTIINPRYSKDVLRVFMDEKMIVGADPATFTVIENNGYNYDEFSKDKNFVYKRGERLYGANPASFKLLEYYYSTDGVTTFFLGSTTEIKDPNTLVTYKNQYGMHTEYAKDSRGVYYRGQFMPEADWMTFGVLSSKKESGYASDKNHVYLRGKIVEGADPLTF